MGPIESIDGLTTENTTWATFSSDKKYRYTLGRRWGTEHKRVAFILLNPSTADALRTDPTVRRCIGYARQWGFDSIEVGNIFALRSTDPKLLYADTDPIGPDNDEAIKEIAGKASLTIVAWGSHGILNNRGRQVLDMIPEPYCLSLNKDGQPGHPLYLSSTIRPTPYNRMVVPG